MEVSVVIPTFNRPELLQRAVRSALNQAKPPSEVVVVNDGIQPLILPETGPVKIRLLATKGRQGPTVARNLALANLSPNINAVCYLDDDDELLPHHIAQLSAILDYGAPYAFSKAIYRFNDHDTEDPEPSNKGPKRYYDPDALMQQNIAPVSSFMHTVEASTEIGGWDPSLQRMEDWDFWARMFIRYGPPHFLNSATNVIYKNLGDNRTDSNEYVYSLACSWRDIVSDRLKLMASEKRCRVSKSDLARFKVPRVGVVMPVYNAQDYLQEAVTSIVTQTFTDWEMIAMNDGSTDRSRKILEDYASRDPRIRIFDMPGNHGVTRALNQALLLSRSEYIARMDADDQSNCRRFEIQVEALDANPEIMVYGSNFVSMDHNLEYVRWSNTLPSDPEEIKKMLPNSCCIGHPTVMMRRKVVETLGGYSTAPEHEAVEDYEYWLRISRKYKISNIPIMMLNYRHHDGQVSAKRAELQKANTKKLQEKYRQ